MAVQHSHADCRMYESRFPEVDDVVIVQVSAEEQLVGHWEFHAQAWGSSSQVTKIAEMGAYVSLLEYNGIEGMILLSELSRRRIRSINKLIKVGTSNFSSQQPVNTNSRP